jgi:hypothetical protein
MQLPAWFISHLEKWFNELAALPSDLDRAAEFFNKTGDDVDGIGFWDLDTHKPVHQISCMCETEHSCKYWKINMLKTLI